MNPAPSFGSILDKPSEGGIRPPPMPVGTYIGVVHGMPKYGESSKKKTEFVEFAINYLSAQEDVDKDALEEIGGFQGKTERYTFYLTENAIWRLERFLEDCGIDTAEYESRREMIEATPGRQVAFTIRHEPSDDGKDLFARIAGTAKVE